MIVLREAMPVSVMKPTSDATENVPPVRKMATTLPINASGILSRICSTIGTDRKCANSTRNIAASENRLRMPIKRVADCWLSNCPP